MAAVGRGTKGSERFVTQRRQPFSRNCFCKAVAYDRLMPLNAGTCGLHSFELLVELFSRKNQRRGAAVGTMVGVYNQVTLLQ